VNYHLSALGRKDTGSYIAFRLERAGGRADLFTDQAIDLIYKASGGIPRSINLLCDASLTHAFADRLARIDADTVRRVIEDKRRIGIAEAGETAQASPAAVPSDSPGRADLQARILRLEENVQKISLILKQVIQGKVDVRHDSTVEQVAQLKHRLNTQRKRSAALMARYSRLKEKYIAILEAGAGQPPQFPRQEAETHSGPGSPVAQPCHEAPDNTDAHGSGLLPADLEFPSDDRDFST